MARRSRPSNSLERAIHQTKFELPQPIRFFLILVGVIGIGLICMESLVSNRPEKIELDKIIHFSGYAALAFTFALALRVKLLIPALVLIALGGVGIEFLQKLTGRSFDTRDMVANCLGIGVGAFAGLTLYWFWGLAAKELAKAKERNRLSFYDEGDIIVTEGQSIQHLYIVKSGKVLVSKKSWDEPIEYGKDGVIGLIAAIKGKAQVTTITAMEPTVLYEMDMDELQINAGGEESPAGIVMAQMADALVDLAERAQTK